MFLEAKIMLLKRYKMEKFGIFMQLLGIPCLIYALWEQKDLNRKILWTILGCSCSIFGYFYLETII